jgi:hypothetical protein
MPETPTTPTTPDVKVEDVVEGTPPQTGLPDLSVVGDATFHVNNRRATNPLTSAAASSSDSQGQGLGPAASLTVITNLGAQFDEANQSQVPNTQLVLVPNQPTPPAEPRQQPTQSRQVSTEPPTPSINPRWFGTPNKFNGAAGSKPQEWLDRMKIHCSTLQIPPMFWSGVAACFMEGQAIHWAARRAQRLHDSKTVDNWDLFEDEFRRVYLPVDRSISARVELQALRMTSKQSALEYVNQFDRLCEDASGMDERSILSTFMLTLTPTLKEAVLRGQPTTYAQAKSIALNWYAYNAVFNPVAAVAPAIHAMDGIPHQETLNYAGHQLPSSSTTGKAATNSTGGAGPRPSYYCTHCKLAGHSNKRCYTLHPELRPDNWTPPVTKTANPSVAVDANPKK